MNNLALIEPTEVSLPPSSALSLSLPASTSFEQWQHIGRELAAREKVLNWWIGDWWAFGEHRYGERAKVAAEGVFGKAFQTLVNYGNVSARIESNRRRLALDWSHHAEVASVAAQSPEAAEMLLDRAEREGMTVAQVRAAVRVLQGREIEPKPSPSSDDRRARLFRAFNCLSDQDEREEAVEIMAEAVAAKCLIDPDSGELIQ